MLALTHPTKDKSIMASTHTDQTNEIPANAQNQYEVTKADLPLHCPMEGMSLWNSHPRVYLPIEANGRERCPYCGAIYVLKRAQ
jgi:uncharacterized Zn-finger protein